MMVVMMMMVMVVVVVMVMHDLLWRGGVSEYVCWETLAEVIGESSKYWFGEGIDK